MQLISRGMVILYVAMMGVVALWVARGQPAMNQTFTGVQIGAAIEEVAYLSGQRLTCAETVPDRCTMTLLGDTLEIVGQRNSRSHPDNLGGQCEASYRGQSWACHVGSHHVQVHWFAMVDSTMGLTPAEMEQIRHQYPVENLSEGAILWGVMVASVVGGLVASLLIVTWPRWDRRARLALAPIAFLLGWFVSFFFGMVATGGLWD